MLRNASEFGVFLDNTFNRTGGEAAKIAGDVGRSLVFAIVKEKWDKGISAGGEIFADAIGGGFGNENWSVFVAFTTNHKFATFEID